MPLNNSIDLKPTTAYLQINPDFLWHPAQQSVLWVTDESRKELITCDTGFCTDKCHRETGFQPKEGKIKRIMVRILSKTEL